MVVILLQFCVVQVHEGTHYTNTGIDNNNTYTLILAVSVVACFPHPPSPSLVGGILWLSFVGVSVDADALGCMDVVVG